MNSDIATGGFATRIASFATDEQVAHRLAERIADGDAADKIAVSLADAGGGRWRVAIYFSAPLDADAVRAMVTAVAGGAAAARLRFARAAAKDWLRASVAGLTPVPAGRFIVHGRHDRARIPTNRIGIEIEAALAFGTGHHGTTRGCLLALDRICKGLNRRRRSPRILDLGTGSGVLAIAAAGAVRSRVLATDIDINAVRVARANIRLNRAGAMVEVVQADGVATRRVRQRAPFDLVFANILLAPLKRIAAPLHKLTAHGAHVVLSGLLPAQANAALAAYHAFALERRIELAGWTTLVLVRRRRRPLFP